MVQHGRRKRSMSRFSTSNKIVRNSSFPFDRFRFFLDEQKRIFFSSSVISSSFLSVPPFSLKIRFNDLFVENGSTHFYETSPNLIKIYCEVYCFPKCSLSLVQNDDKLNEIKTTFECMNEDLSVVLLSNEVCLEQRNWRVRTNLLAQIRPNTEDRFICLLDEFPYGNVGSSFVFVNLQQRSGSLKEISFPSLQGNAIRLRTTVLIKPHSVS